MNRHLKNNLYPMIIIGFLAWISIGVFADDQTKSVVQKNDTSDTYNFYFQKGAAPQSVIQGGAGQAAAKTSAQGVVTEESTPNAVEKSLSASSTVNEVASVSPREENENPLTLSLGYGILSDEGGSGASAVLGARYSFARSLGIRGQYWIGSTPGGYYDSNVMAAIDMTPIRSRVLDFSFFAGARTYRKYEENSPHWSNTSNKRKLGYKPVFGVSALVSFSSRFGVELTAHQSLVGDEGRYGNAALAYRF